MKVEMAGERVVVNMSVPPEVYSLLKETAREKDFRERAFKEVFQTIHRFRKALADDKGMGSGISIENEA